MLKGKSRNHMKTHKMSVRINMTKNGEDFTLPTFPGLVYRQQSPDLRVKFRERGNETESVTEL